MAAVKWYNEFSDIDGDISGVEILDRDYSGAKIKVKGGDIPFVLDMPDVTNPYETIRAIKAEIKWTSQDEVNFGISELAITDDRKYTVRFYRYNQDLSEKSYLWFGYLTFADCEEPYASKPYYVNASATCGLTFLREDYFLDAFGSFVNGQISLIKIIANCLSSTGQELDIHTYVNLFEQGIPYGIQSALSQANIDADGLRGMKADAVLKGILSTLGAFVVQSNGAWSIKSVKEQASYQNVVRKFNANGDFISSSTVIQAASFGRAAYDSSTPNVRPRAGVVQKLAKPNSIVIETVSPGIPVNRLVNGVFGGPILGGTIPGWQNRLGGISWSRDGSNRPDDPYRFVMNGHVYLDVKKKRYPLKPDVYLYQEDFTINTGQFDAEDSKTVKLVLSGAFRSKNVLGVVIFIIINEDYRKFSSYLNENGEWLLSKNKTDEIEIKSITGFTDKTGPITDFPLQTFEITSDVITNFLEVSGESIAHIRIRVYPGGRFPGQVDPNSCVSFEDFSLTVKTDSPFEAEHKYQVDAKFPIRNPTKSEYTAIIADKIDIITPEQRRDVNRVMTGYMTRLNGQLTTGWRRYTNGVLDPTDNDYEPIQKKSLRERVRLLCGKRDVYQGKFYGYGILPDHSIFNRRDNPSEPEKFHTITGWRWDVKFKTYTLALFKLDYTRLENEVIDIVNDANGARGNRLYNGASGSTTSSGGSIASPVPEEIVIDDVDTIAYTVLTADFGNKTVDIGTLIQSTHIPADLDCNIITYPPWINSISVYRGEDLAPEDVPTNGILQIKWMGKPTATGNFQIVIELIAPDGPDCLLIIPLIVYPKTLSTYTLLSTDPDPAIIGALPGQYEVPDKSDVRIIVNGTHDQITGTLIGGGNTGNTINHPFGFTSTDMVDSASYRLYDDTDGAVLPVGQYRLINHILRGDVETNLDQIDFILYDEAFLAKLKIYITKAGSELGEISIDGTSVFVHPEKCNIKDVVDEVEHDEVILTLEKEGVVIETKTYSLPDSEMSGEYLLFDEDQQLEAGVYTTTVTLKLSGTDALKRYGTFEISEAEPKPEAGLVLGSFKPGTTNFTKIVDLPLVGGEYDLPVNFTLMFDGLGGLPYKSVEWEFYKLRTGAFAAVNIETYTGYPQNITYPEAVTNEKLLIFGVKNSTQISDVHEAPETVRVVFTARDEEGKIIGIRQSDFSFRVPLAPEDQSGLRLITVAPGSGAITLIDANIPKTGRKVTLPLPNWYSISARNFAGASFDHVKVKFAKKIAGVYVNLHLFGSDYVILANAGGIVTELSVDNIAYIVGNNVSGLRYLNNPSATPVLIDEPGEYKATFIPILATVEGVEKYVEFEVVESSIDDTPVDECCGGGSTESFSATIGDGSSTSFTLTHSFGTKDLSIEIYEVSTNEQVFTTVIRDTIDTAIISFKRPPAVNSYRVVIIK